MNKDIKTLCKSNKKIYNICIKNKDYIINQKIKILPPKLLEYFKKFENRFYSESNESERK